MRYRLVSRGWVMIAVVATTFVGCGQSETGPTRYDISGSVNFAGQPVPSGTIQFRPDTSKGNSGPAANAEIVNGRYDTKKLGTGTVGGSHVVIIHGFDGNARPDEELPMGKALFSEYTIDADFPESSGGTMDFQIDQQ